MNKKAIDNTFIARVFLETKAFKNWEAAGYKLSIDLSPIESICDPGVQTRSGSIEHHFTVIITYYGHDNWELNRIMDEARYEIKYAAPYCISTHDPYTGNPITFHTDSNPSNPYDCKLTAFGGLRETSCQIADYFFSQLEMRLRWIRDISDVNIFHNYCLDSGGGGSSTDPPTNPDPKPIVTDVNCTPEDEALSIRTSEVSFYFDIDGGMMNFIRDYQNANVEYAVTLSYDSTEEKWSVSAPVTSNLPNMVEFTCPPNSVAYIHNHPNGYSAHSMTDVLIHAQLASTTAPGLETSFVVSSDGSIYALVIEDKSKVETFYYEQMYNKDALNNERSILRDQMTPHSTYDIASVHALAYMLEKYDTGMKIMRYEGDGYRTRHTEITFDNYQYIDEVKLTKCR